MAGQRFWAHGATVTFDGTAIEHIEGIELPDETTEEVEITSGSSSGVEEMLAGLRRSGSLQLTCRKVPGATGQDGLRTARSNGTTAEVVITAPTGATDDSLSFTITFDAFVTGIGGSMPQVANEPAMVTYTLKVDGDITEAVS